ncbi:hypothetical protein ACFXKR_06020 [Streptomyces violascens]
MSTIDAKPLTPTERELAALDCDRALARTVRMFLEVLDAADAAKDGAR